MVCLSLWVIRCPLAGLKWSLGLVESLGITNVRLWLRSMLRLVLWWCDIASSLYAYGRRGILRSLPVGTPTSPLEIGLLMRLIDWLVTYFPFISSSSAIHLRGEVPGCRAVDGYCLFVAWGNVHMTMKGMSVACRSMWLRCFLQVAWLGVGSFQTFPWLCL